MTEQQEKKTTSVENSAIFQKEHTGIPYRKFPSKPVCYYLKNALNSLPISFLKNGVYRMDNIMLLTKILHIGERHPILMLACNVECGLFLFVRTLFRFFEDILF